MTEIEIKIGNTVIDAFISNTPTGEAILNSLPIESSSNTWGDEIYFQTNAQASLEPDSKAEVEIGELAYWPNMPAFCIFFGPTPVSSGSQPVAASAVNVFGKLKHVDLELLRSIGGGEKIVVTKKIN